MMDRLPDILGYPLEEAIAECKSLGYDIEIVQTRPVKALPEKKPRVVRMSRLAGEKIVLTVVFEDIRRGGGL